MTNQDVITLGDYTLREAGDQMLLDLSDGQILEISPELKDELTTYLERMKGGCSVDIRVTPDGEVVDAKISGRAFNTFLDNATPKQLRTERARWANRNDKPAQLKVTEIDTELVTRGFSGLDFDHLPDPVDINNMIGYIAGSRMKLIANSVAENVGGDVSEDRFVDECMERHQEDITSSTFQAIKGLADKMTGLVDYDVWGTINEAAKARFVDEYRENFSGPNLAT